MIIVLNLRLTTNNGQQKKNEIEKVADSVVWTDAKVFDTASM